MSVHKVSPLWNWQYVRMHEWQWHLEKKKNRFNYCRATVPPLIYFFNTYLFIDKLKEWCRISGYEGRGWPGGALKSYSPCTGKTSNSELQYNFGKVFLYCAESEVWGRKLPYAMQDSKCGYWGFSICYSLPQSIFAFVQSFSAIFFGTAIGQSHMYSIRVIFLAKGFILATPARLSSVLHHQHVW